MSLPDKLLSRHHHVLSSLMDIAIAFGIYFWARSQFTTFALVQYAELTATGYWFIYMLCKDCFGAASIGKRVFGLRLVRTTTLTLVSPLQSIYRNALRLSPLLLLIAGTWLVARFTDYGNPFIDWVEEPKGLVLIIFIIGSVSTLGLLIANLLNVHSRTRVINKHAVQIESESESNKQPGDSGKEHLLVDDSTTLTALSELGLNLSATQSDIRLAYKRLCSQHHPDKHTKRGEAAVAVATERFLRIQEAFLHLTTT